MNKELKKQQDADKHLLNKSLKGDIMSNEKLSNEDKQNSEQLNILAVVCSACGELIPDHEKYPAMMEMDVDDVECVSCEMKYRDSADLDNCFG